MRLAHLASRIYGTPLLISRAKLDIILSVLGPRIGLSDTGTIEPEIKTPPVPVEAHSGITVIPVHGSLVRRGSVIDAASGLTSYQDVNQSLDTALADPVTRGILLDIDSPGGEAAGVFELADKIRAAGVIKPVWAHVNDAAFSAAYALAAGASRITLSETAGVGSIGVIALHVDQSVKDARDGIRYTAIYAGSHKNDLSPHAPLSGEAAASLQARIDGLYDIFVTRVAAFRGLDVADVRATEAGHYFGENAVNTGLADGVRSMDQALADFAHHLNTQKTTNPLTTTYQQRERAMSENQTPTMKSGENEAIKTGETVKTMKKKETVEKAAQKSATESTVSDDMSLNMKDTGMEKARAIAGMCMIAGCPERTVEFLSSSTSEAEVRETLLAERAGQTEITSHITMDTGIKKTSSPENSPVVMAVKKLANRE